MKPPGILYIVATPIGNLQDISARALEILREVDLIAAEDTRHSRKLLDYFGLRKPLTSHHQHNQSKSAKRLIQRLLEGDSIAVITDAGTPLVSDPGARLVKSAHRHGVRVIPIPGPSALSAALSVCGFDFRSIHFEGFLPANQADRTRRLKQLAEIEAGLVFFEAPHRVEKSLLDMVCTLGEKRAACIAREMTKLHESIQVGELGQLAERFGLDQERRKGEFVVIIDQARLPPREIDSQVERALKILSEETSPRQAAEITAKIFNVRRNLLYRRILAWQNAPDGD